MILHGSYLHVRMHLESSLEQSTRYVINHNQANKVPECSNKYIILLRPSKF